jgi:subtilisin-like proprotein convertase family protein
MPNSSACGRWLLRVTRLADKDDATIRSWKRSGGLHKTKEKEEVMKLPEYITPSEVHRVCKEIG